MPDRARELDVIVWGATGFTGRLVAAYLLERYGLDGELRWAMGGRSARKLEAVRSELAAACGADPESIPLVVGDAGDEASLEALAARTRVVCTTVGPYARYGSKLVAACARAGVHYCDLTGELHWMRRMIDLHHKEAEASGARIVHTCGFDSIPSDLGVLFLQRAMQERYAAAAAHVKCRVKAFRGAFSGGTVASMLNMLAEAAEDPSIRRLMSDPYALNPEGERGGPDGPDRNAPFYDEDFGAWTAPFVMAGINTRVVRRSNALLERAYGGGFAYDEAMLMGPGPLGLAKATALTLAIGSTLAAGAIEPLRNALARLLPSPGEGPDAAQREAGFFDIRFLGRATDGVRASLRAKVTGDRDPGYGSTARMLGESAVCLARDALAVDGGFWTPASAMGELLIERLRSNAGLCFEIEPD